MWKLISKDETVLKQKIEEKLEPWWKGKATLFVDDDRQMGKA
jgi:hypothetical protein